MTAKLPPVMALLALMLCDCSATRENSPRSKANTPPAQWGVGSSKASETWTPSHPSSVPREATLRVTQIRAHGITWSFSEEVEAGRFVTGDWWVVGPVTIVEIVPEPTGTRNGTALNPRGGRQGYDSRAQQFDEGDQLSTLPARVVPNTAVVSSVSKAGGTDWKEFKNVGVLQTQAVLTVLETAPSAGSFRPAYAGAYKKLFSIDDIRWDALPKLPPIPSAPLGSDIVRWFSMPRIDHITSWGIQYSCAEDNWGSCYGREVSDQVSEAALFVLLDTPYRVPLALQLIQLGLDNYGVLKAGGGFPIGINNPGGHFSGRKFPIVFAATLLNDPEILAFDSEFANDLYFQEDLQTYFSSSGKALWGSPCVSKYTATCSGRGAKDCRDPNGLIDGCPSYRTCCTSATWVGQALAVRLMRAETVWNHPPFFAYVDRWVSEMGANPPINPWGGVRYGSSAFREDMWRTYRPSVSGAP